MAKQFITEAARMQKLAGIISEAKVVPVRMDYKGIATFLNAYIDEFIQKVYDPGSKFEIIGDPEVATASTSDVSGIDASFNKEHMLELFPEDGPYNKIKSVDIAGRTVYYNEYH